MHLSKLEVCLLTLISLIVIGFMPYFQSMAQAAQPKKAAVQAQAPAKTQTKLQKQVAVLSAKAPNLDPKVLELALIAHSEATTRGLVSRPLLTVIDYSKRSVEKRLWIFDLSSNQLLMETHVTHGEKSGKDRATRFSNENGSHKTSIGVYTTAETYNGQHGYSLRLDGHDEGFNDRARERAIVIHGAEYASERYIKRNGTLGLSWACPAVDSKIARKLIDTIKEGSLVFVYYPDNRWLRNSSFLNNSSLSDEG
jgi:hypothetical protein